MNQKLLEQIALAKQAGSKAMAKDFFAKTPGAGGPADGEAPSDGQGAPGGAPPSGDAMPPSAQGAPEGSPSEEAGETTPEELEELLRLLQSQGGHDSQGA